MSKQKTEVDKLSLESRNQAFLSILSIVSKQFGIKYSDSQLAAFAVTLDDIANLHAQTDQLVENTSNKQARVKQFGIMENTEGVLAQLYWKKHSSFMIDLIAAQAQSEIKDTPEEFNLKLGLSRHLIGLFTEQIRNPEKPIFGNTIEAITKEYLERHEVFMQYQQYERYGLFRQIGRKLERSDLFVQSLADGFHELKEHIRERENIWPTTLLPQLKASIEQQQEHLKVNFPYCFKIYGVTFYANKPIQEMHPQALQRLVTALGDTFCAEQCTHVVVDVQSTGESYLEVLTQNKTKYYGIVEQKTYHNFYFPNQFIHKNEGQGFYLGYVSDSEYSYGDSGSTEKAIVCTHAARHSEMNDIVHTKYKEVLKALDKNTDINMFLKTLFCYSYLYIKVMPYARGSAAISEWLMRGLAKAKGVDLGPFAEGLSWDFSAFIRISAEKYAAEYQKYFPQITPLSTNHKKVVEPIVRERAPAVEKIEPSSTYCC